MKSLIIQIPSSFVKRKLKLKGERGSGESKLFVGSQKKEEEFDDFFNSFSNQNKYYFSKTNLLDYLKHMKIEYIAQKCNQYQEAGEDLYSSNLELVANMAEQEEFELEKFTDGTRYYIRAIGDSKKVFDDFFREIALPKITNLEIKKNQNDFNFTLQLNLDEIISRNVEDDIDKNLPEEIDFPHQRIFFGAPGTGKSYQLNKQAKENFGSNYERVTFHPNYMYGNFVGAYKPFPKILKDKDGNFLTDEHGNIQESITYQYIEGVFMRSLVKALKNPNENYLLVVEEINRANVAAVFGDIFQLLDRDGSGKSEYNIATSKELQEYLKKEFDGIDLEPSIRAELGDDYSSLFLPSNFYIWATMNSADQGVMPMDTAFRRRWDFTYLGINDAVDSTFEKYMIRISENEIAKWNDFRCAVNSKLSACKIPEDKLIGPYFISKSVLETKNINELTAIVKDKVLMYLYEDAAKAYRNTIFAEGKHNTYSAVCENFDLNAKSLFKGNLDLKTVKTDNEQGTSDIEDDN